VLLHRLQALSQSKSIFFETQLGPLNLFTQDTSTVVDGQTEMA